MGFLAAPSAHQEEGVHGHVGYPTRHPGVAGIRPTGPTLSATVPLAGFLNLPAVSSSLHRPTIFRWVALLGFPLQGFMPSAQPQRLVAAGMPS